MARPMSWAPFPRPVATRPTRYPESPPPRRIARAVGILRRRRARVHVEDLGLLGFLSTVFWLVALTNLINLIDGLDGLAGGIAFMLMCLLANVGLGVEATFNGFLAAGMAGALLGFLYYNFPPARIFLARGLTFKEPDRETTEKLRPVRVKLGEAVRMVMGGEITQGTTCALILKASKLISDCGMRNAD